MRVSRLTECLVRVGRVVRPLSMLVVALALAAPALAQRTTATIRGRVMDPTGAVVAGAQVKVTNEGTGRVCEVLTNASGSYSCTDLPVGSYSVDVEFAGFKGASFNKVVVNVADVREFNVKLETGAITESVEVEVPAVSTQTVGGDVSGLISGTEARELPLNGRNFMQLAMLMPGVAAPDALNVKDKGLLGGSDLAVSGSSTTANMWMVDGVNNVDGGSNRTILIYPSVEALEEFKVHRNAYGAEFGGASGAQINLVTRGGTNEFHGSVFYFGRNKALNATNYFLEQAGKEKEELERHDFGWTLGGPIIKDKLHFFASQEWNNEDRGTVRTAFVPTEAELSGDFNQRIEGCSGVTPVDPLTGAPFPGNIIPADRISPAGRAYMSLYAKPNTTPGAGSCNNWVGSITTPLRWRQENIRLDYSFTNTTRLMLRYTQDSWKNDAPSHSQSGLWGDDPFPAVDSNWDQPSKSFTAQLTHNVGSKATNTLSFSYSDNSITVTRGEGEPGLNAEINSLLPSTFDSSTKLYGDDRGHPVFWGGGGYASLWNEAPFVNDHAHWVLRDDYSAVFGKHFVKLGVFASLNSKNEDTQSNGSTESGAFWGSAGLNGWGGTTGNILSDFLLKDMAFGFSEISANRSAQTRWRDLEFYAHDSWKVRSNVTMDLGLRASKFYNVYEDTDRYMGFSPALFNAALGNDPCNGMIQPEGRNWCQEATFKGGTTGPNRSLYDQPKWTLAPRFGLAWDVNGDGKTALRVGIGQFYLRERVSPAFNLALNPPFTNFNTGARALDTAVDPCGGCIGRTAGVPRSGREEEMLVPNNWQWNLTAEHEILRNTTVSLSYVGSKGTHLLRSYDVNQVRRGDSNGNGVDDRLEYVQAGNNDAAQAPLRPYGAFGDVQINRWDHSGDSNYHALQAQIVGRFGRGSQYQASYTWSRTISNDSLQNSSGGLDEQATFSDLDEPRLDRGLALTHRPHMFNASLVLALPTFDDQSGFVKNVFGDWQLTTIFQAISGAAVTVHATGVPGLNTISGTGFANTDRPNVVEGQSCNATSGPKEQILNPAAWTLNGFNLGQNGNSGRGVCLGPSFVQLDLAMYKNIRVSNRVRLQLRFEVFNVLNRANFLGNQLNLNLGPSNVVLNAPLESATQIVSATTAGNFGQSTVTRDPRQAQFGIKVIF